MTHARNFFINDRIKALITLMIFMAVAIIIVFIGLELLKEIPSLSLDQKMYIDKYSYPGIFKIMVVLGWGGISVLSAYLILTNIYTGFFTRFSHYFNTIEKYNRFENFHFRKNEKSSIIKNSLFTLLDHYRNQFETTEKELIKLKEKISAVSQSNF